ncbi:hypothetical protein CRYUN_Cryun13aG0115900 [Craigia yunnanensis]
MFSAILRCQGTPFWFLEAKMMSHHGPWTLLTLLYHILQASLIVIVFPELPNVDSLISCVMPVAVNFSAQALRQRTCLKAMAADTIKHFYMCINEKNLKKLGGYISEDCYIKDCSFFIPFNGKKEVMHFFDLFMRSMGQNVKVIIEHVCEGDDFTAGVEWHLEWKQTEVPFTRGCSFYECFEEGEKLVIKKALIVIESPIKPWGGCW